MTSSHRRRHARTHRSATGISGPVELVQSVPYLLGFRPQESLVLVGLRDGYLHVTARVDLSEILAGRLLAETLSTIVEGGAPEIVALIFADGSEPGSLGAHWSAAQSVLAAALDVGCCLLDVLEVADGRWRSVLCGDERCCPATGTPVPRTPSAFVAAATVDGIAPLASRAEVADRFEPEPDEVRASLDPAIARRENLAVRAVLEGRRQRHDRTQMRALLAAARHADRGTVGPPGPAPTARFGVALSGVEVRDAVWMAVDAGRADGRPLWLHLARHLPTPYDAPALFLYGWAAWRSGDGAGAAIAAHRALDSDPTYSAASLLCLALRRGFDPRRLPSLHSG